MFHKMPFILISIIVAILVLNPFIPMEMKQALYATSLTIKSIIILLLPFVIFGLLFKTAVGLAQRATAIIGLIIILVCCSNATSAFLSHFVGEWVYRFDLSLIQPKDTEGLTPAWSLTFPKLIANNVAMGLGIVFGILLARIRPTMAEQIANRLDWVVAKILKSFTYLIPIFVAGFVVKLQSDGVMDTIVKDYAAIFIWVAISLYGYIILAYFALNHFNLRHTLSRIKNMLPAAISGFSTMSSAAVMPLTISGVERNAKNKDLARSVVPATVNIHLIGDCFAIPIFAYAVMKSYGVPEPALLEYLVFVFYFVIAKFSVAAIPGGGIIVMLPILESCLGFNAEMLSLTTALYILFDPVITCANVLGNGAFASLIDKLASFKERKVALSQAENPI